MANMNANHDLSRFVSAQEGRYEMAYAELANGRKRSHWMWYIFPQLSGLGSSPMARRYALSGLEEAKVFLAHPLLGTRLVNISALLLSLDKGNPTEIFGFPDDIKLSDDGRCRQSRSNRRKQSRRANDRSTCLTEKSSAASAADGLAEP